MHVEAADLSDGARYATAGSCSHSLTLIASTISTTLRLCNVFKERQLQRKRGRVDDATTVHSTRMYMATWVVASVTKQVWACRA